MRYFSVDWFSNNIGIWEIHLAKFKGQPVEALEIGCFEGRATTWLLDNILTHEKAKITCVDTFEGGIEHKTIANVDFSGTAAIFMKNVEEFGKKVRLFVEISQNKLRNLQNNSFDIIYVDGSHQAVDVLADTVYSWPLLRKGGVMIFDDYMWDAYQEPTLNPRLAIDSFLAVYKGKYNLLHKEYQVIVEKV